MNTNRKSPNHALQRTAPQSLSLGVRARIARVAADDHFSPKDVFDEAVRKYIDFGQIYGGSLRVVAATLVHLAWESLSLVSSPVLLPLAYAIAAFVMV